MLKTLLKKQMLEIFRSYFYDSKKNKRRSKASTIFYLLLFVLIMVGMMSGMFSLLAYALCGPLQSVGTGWLYFTLMGLLAVFLGAFGSVFNTYSGLYLSKDNDLLLSMPIPVSTIMAARLLAVYLMGLMYSSVATLPAAIVYWCVVPQTVSSVIGSLLLVALVSLIVLFLSCALGWAVAKISLKLKNKSFVTVLVSLLFIGVYYFFCLKAQTLIQELIANAAVYGAKIKGAAYPLYLFGRVGEGDWPAIALTTLVVLAVMALTWYTLARSFLKIATSSGKTTRAVYREKAVRPRSAPGALFSKEMGRFLASSSYILNCGFGTLMLVFAGVALLWKGGELAARLQPVFVDRPGCLAVLACAAVCLIASMNEMVVPSVSLEAKTLWLSHSLPITPWQALRAKMSVQLLLTVFPAFFCAACATFILPVKSVPEVALVLLVPVANAFFFTVLGLTLGLKMPNLTWTNELAPIKQSMNIMIALFGGWFYALALGGLFLWRGWRIGANAYLGIAFAVTAAVSAALWVWLKKKGTKIYETL